MYETFYHLTSEPFRLSPDHHFCFSHRSYAKAKAYMQYAFNRAEGFVMVTGRPGTGKSTLISDLVESLPRSQVSVGTLVTTQLEAEDLLQLVAHAFGLNLPLTNKASVLQYFNTMLRREREKGRRSLLIIDEAQNLSGPALEELRLLTNLQQNNQPLLQIFLVGQEELRDLVHTPQMEQVYQRIVAASHIEALSQDETREYVYHRLAQAGWQGDPQLSEALFPIIHRFSEGIPRRINLICGRLLLHGAVERQHRIGVADARLVVSELHAERLTALSPQADVIFDAQDSFPGPLPPEKAGSTQAGAVQVTSDERSTPTDAKDEENTATGRKPSDTGESWGGRLRRDRSESTPSERPESKWVSGDDGRNPQRRPPGEAAGGKAWRATRDEGERQLRRRRQLEMLENIGQPELERPRGHSWLWWLLLLVLLLAGVAVVGILGYLG